MQPAAALLVGLMVAVLFLGWIHLRLAAIAAVAEEAGVLWHDIQRPQEAASWQVHVALLALTLIVIWLAVRTRPRVPKRRPGRWRFGTAAALVVLAFGFLIVGTYRQAEALERTREAEVVTTTVRAQIDDDTIGVAFPDGHEEEINVYESVSYPVGTELRMATDDDGWRELASEPYDATPWVALAGLVGFIGAGLLWRYTDQAKAVA